MSRPLKFAHLTKHQLNIKFISLSEHKTKLQEEIKFLEETRQQRQYLNLNLIKQNKKELIRNSRKIWRDLKQIKNLINQT